MLCCKIGRENDRNFSAGQRPGYHLQDDRPVTEHMPGYLQDDRSLTEHRPGYQHDDRSVTEHSYQERESGGFAKAGLSSHDWNLHHGNIFSIISHYTFDTK